MRSLAEVEGKSHSEKVKIAQQSARKRKEEQVSVTMRCCASYSSPPALSQMEEVYRILAITLGTPPKPDEEFTWVYRDKVQPSSSDILHIADPFVGSQDFKFHSVVSTPLKFAKEHASVGGAVGDKISLIHDPRNKEGLYTVDRLGNVVGGRPVLYVNTEIAELKQVAISLLKQGTPVWFGCDVGASSSSLLGVMDAKLFGIDQAFSCKNNLTKTQRLATGDSAMTHAMVLTAVHLSDEYVPSEDRVFGLLERVLRLQLTFSIYSFLFTTQWQARSL